MRAMMVVMSVVAVGPRVRLREVSADDLEEFVRLAADSVEMHRGWVYAPTTEEEFKEYLSKYDKTNAFGFLVRLNSTGRLAGLVNIFQIVRGSYQRGVLGYGGFRPTAGHGYVREGVGLAVRHAFDHLGLHRLEADIRPENRPSRRLVESLGFRLEGFSPGFVRMDGVWHDYERWAITADHGQDERV
jgi:ribosomal-protein-alanine N-acetyltransferase